MLIFERAYEAVYYFISLDTGFHVQRASAGFGDSFKRKTT